ncbi:hypothetical protein [Bacillus massilinigeriensis]|nr:hypothetical protein [Bacillus massilionigeriensis]
MSMVKWIEIIILVLKLIAEGMSKDQAASKVAGMYGVSASSILKRL